MSERGDIKTITEYFTKEDTYDSALYTSSPIPKNSPVRFLGEYTNFYGRYVKVEYCGKIYYIKPKSLSKRTTQVTELTEPVTGCYAKHPKFGVLGLAARIMTDPLTSKVDYWLAIDKDNNLRTIAIEDCERIYQVEDVRVDAVTYLG